MVTVTYSGLAAWISGVAGATAGDIHQLDDGSYSGAAITMASVSGVTAKSKNLLGAVLTGGPISIGGDGLTFEGFDLQYVKATGDFVLFDGTACRFTRNLCHFDNGGTGDQKWFMIRDNNVMFDHNTVFGKTTVDDMFLVGGGTQRRSGRILYNHFHTFNEGTNNTKSEVLRIGESSMVFIDFGCEVAYNLFETIDADTEVISVKSMNNNIHHNTFRNTNGSLVLRQAVLNHIHNNVFINTGMRVHGNNHEIDHNCFIRNTLGGVSRTLFLASATVADHIIQSGTNNNAGSSGTAISLNSDEAKVYNCNIHDNVIAMDDQATGLIVMLGDSTSEAFQPTSNFFSYNIIQALDGTLTNAISGSVGWGHNVLSGNILYISGSAALGDMKTSGYFNVNPQLLRTSDLAVRCTYVLNSGDVGVVGP